MILLEETLAALQRAGYGPEDVVEVQTRGYSFPWEQFAVCAQLHYDSGYGTQEIVADLRVVGDGWWLERAEYDGSEWWEFKKQPALLPRGLVLQLVER